MAIPEKCPLCLAESKNQSVVTSHVYGNDSNISRAFFKCSECEVIYQYPLLTKEEEENFYISEFESFMASRSGKSGGWKKSEDHIKANEPTRIRRMTYLSPLLPKNGRILEVGCSSGFMLWPLIQKEYQCFGIEPSGVFSDFVKSKGLKVFNSIDDPKISDEQEKFDLIMHFFVLEHISDPLAFLQKQLSLLNKGGKLVFEIPNSSDPLYTVYDIPEFERFYWSIAHPWYFNKQSLEYLLLKLNTSFNISFDQRYDLSNHFIWAKDGKPGGMNKYSNFFSPELEECYKKTLINNGHCDTLIVTINKS